MTNASTMVENMVKNSVRYVHQMAIYMVCNVFWFFLNSPSELTFWKSLVYIYIYIYIYIKIVVSTKGAAFQRKIVMFDEGKVRAFLTALY